MIAILALFLLAAVVGADRWMFARLLKVHRRRQRFLATTLEALP